MFSIGAGKPGTSQLENRARNRPVIFGWTWQDEELDVSDHVQE